MNTITLTNDSSRALLLTGSLLILVVSLFVLLFWSQNAATLELIYPGTALIIGGALYVARPSFYLGFCWWIGFITPFVRRLVDYQAGAFNPTNPIMLAPYLVCAISLITFFRLGGRLLNRRYFPFLLSLSGVVYGYLVGVAKAGVLSATFGVLEWILPVLMGLHVLLLWQDYPEHRRVVRSTYTWAVLVMSLYGIYQFANPPAWDALWLSESGMVGSMGKPEPYRIRVFSTMNAGGPFAVIMMTGLLVLFDGRGSVARIATIPGYLSLMFTFVRNAWGGWFVGVLFLLKYLSGKARTRMIVLLLFALALAVPIALQGPGAERLESRVGTLGNLEENGSFRARVALYIRESPRVVTNVVGSGIGSYGNAAKLSTGESVNLDSGLLAVPLTLGWLGTALYLGGLIWMLRNALRSWSLSVDRFAVICTAIVLAYSAMMIFGNQFVGFKGIIVWSFLGLALSSDAYHKEQPLYL